MTYNPQKESQMRLFVLTAKGQQEIIFPDRSALFVKTSITKIEGATRYRRTVNGSLVNLSNPHFDKRMVSVSGTDKILPALAAIPSGSSVILHAATVVREVGAAPSKEFVPGSVWVAPGGTYVEYRPIIRGRIDVQPMTETEWRSDADWSFEVLEH